MAEKAAPWPNKREDYELRDVIGNLNMLLKISTVCLSNEPILGLRGACIFAQDGCLFAPVISKSIFHDAPKPGLRSGNIAVIVRLT